MPSNTNVDMEQVAKALKRNNFASHIAESSEAARKLVMDMVPPDAVVGIGDSASVRQVGIIAALEQRGVKLLNPFREGLTDPAERLKTMRNAMRSDVFLTGCNALTLDGKLVSTDMAGNRVAGTIFGARKVILVVGANKIVKDINEALDRIKHVISPYHAFTKKRKTPCAVTLECSDCNSPQRICNITVILEKQPLWTEIAVMLVNEDIGLGWDPAWPQERIERIKTRYSAVTWMAPFSKDIMKSE